jgi:uncharacterized protein (DUF2141 family)
MTFNQAEVINTVKIELSQSSSGTDRYQVPSGRYAVIVINEASADGALGSVRIGSRFQKSGPYVFSEEMSYNTFILNAGEQIDAASTGDTALISGFALEYNQV